MEISLEKIKLDKKIKEFWQILSVRIWSNEYFMYWRPGCAGYTPDGLKAGIWKFKDTYRLTKHCDPSKQIRFRAIKKGDTVYS